MWQIREISIFILQVFSACPGLVEIKPIKIASGRYEEKPKAEKTQADLIKEMAQKLASLPRFTAWTKIIDKNGEVLKTKVRTLKLDSDERFSRAISKINRVISLTITHESCCTRHELIEAEIAKRQARWRKAGTGKPPPTRSAV